MSATRPARRLNPLHAEKLFIPFSNGSITATTTVKCFSVPAGRELLVERVTYINPTGLTGDNTNNFRCEVKKGGTVAMLVFNTDTNDSPAGATLAAGTWVAGAPPSGAVAGDVWLAETDALDVVFTLEGAQTLPAGNGVIEARLY